VIRSRSAWRLWKATYDRYLDDCLFRNSLRGKKRRDKGRSFPINQEGEQEVRCLLCKVVFSSAFEPEDLILRRVGTTELCDMQHEQGDLKVTKCIENIQERECECEVECALWL